MDVIIDDFGEILDVQKIQSGSWGGGGCFITTAVCNALGKSADCYELSLLRGLRDNYLLTILEGQELVDEYYRITSSIVNNIDNMADRREFYVYLYETYLRTIIALIEKESFEEAVDVYRKMVNYLKTKFKDKIQPLNSGTNSAG